MYRGGFSLPVLGCGVGGFVFCLWFFGFFTVPVLVVAAVWLLRGVVGPWFRGEILGFRFSSVGWSGEVLVEV